MGVEQRPPADNHLDAGPRAQAGSQYLTSTVVVGYWCTCSWIGCGSAERMLGEYTNTREAKRAEGAIRASAIDLPDRGPTPTEYDGTPQSLRVVQPLAEPHYATRCLRGRDLW